MASHRPILRSLLLNLFASTLLAGSPAQSSEPAPPAVDVQVVADEADAVAAAIEKAFGRQRLVESFCDPRKLLSSYNEARGRTGPCRCGRRRS
jgi:hypothetical protein